MRTFLQLVPLIFAVAVHSGCVAFNIPSERLHDPEDHGGLLGDWQSESGRTRAVCHLPDHQGESWSLDGGPLGPDTLDPTLEPDRGPAADEVPWPRYHPVPTRPILPQSAP